MVHAFSAAVTANRLAAMSNVGAFLSRWQRTPFIRVEGTALTQLRSVRRGGGDRRHSADFDEEKETKQRTDGRDERRHEGAFSSTDPEQIESEFRAEFKRFLRQYFLSKDKKAMGENFDESVKMFIRDFNRRTTEFEVEQNTQRTPRLSFVLGCLGLTMLGAFIAYRLLFRNSVLPEHRAIIAQQHSAISFDQFVQDYLAAGEVRMVYFYPGNSVAVAILHPGAVIRGQPFYGSSVLIGLDPYAGGTHFLRAFEDAQNRLGIEPREHVPVAVQLPSVLPAFSLLLGWLIVTALFIKYCKVNFAAQMFKVKRKSGRGKANDGNEQMNE